MTPLQEDLHAAAQQLRALSVLIDADAPQQARAGACTILLRICATLRERAVDLGAPCERVFEAELVARLGPERGPKAAALAGALAEVLGLDKMARPEPAAAALFLVYVAKEGGLSYERVLRLIEGVWDAALSPEDLGQVMKP